jgi:hypothetical protein
MARRMQCFDFDVVTNREGFTVTRSLGDFGTVFASDDWDGVGLELQTELSDCRDTIDGGCYTPSRCCRQRGHDG